MLDPAIVVGIDDRLLAVVRPRVRAGRRKRDAKLARKPEQRLAACTLRLDRRVQRLATPRADLDLRGDQLTGHRFGEERIGVGGAAHLGVARRKPERPRIEDPELLLDAYREVA